MRPLSDKGARMGGLALFLVACGGAEFELALLPDSGGGVAEGGSGEAGAGDAERPDGAPAALLPEAGSGDAWGPTDASHDSGDVDATPPACVTEAPATQNCGTGHATFPTTLCLVNCVGSTGCSVGPQPTPAQCGSWCTFTCACLSEAGVCGAGSSIASCTQGGLGSSIDLECSSP